MDASSYWLHNIHKEQSPKLLNDVLKKKKKKPRHRHACPEVYRNQRYEASGRNAACGLAIADVKAVCTSHLRDHLLIQS